MYLRWMNLCFYVYIVFCFICYETKSEFLKKSSEKKLKILGLFPHPGKSHFFVIQPILEELARRGHELTVISYFPRTNSSKVKESLPNYKDISLISDKYEVSEESVNLGKIHHIPFVTSIKELLFLSKRGQKSCEDGMTNPGVLEFLHSNQTIDLIFIENFNTDCFLSFVHKYKVPFVGISTCQIMSWTNNHIANPDDEANIPSVLGYKKMPMNFFDRTANLLWIRVQNIMFDVWYNYHHRGPAEKLFGSDLPRFVDIAKQQSLLLTNTHWSIHGSRPQLPNIIEIGGVHLPSSIKPLPQDLAKFLDEAKEGVLYFCLGSMIKASTMPPARLQFIINVLRSIPRKIVWKWEDDNFTAKPDNVFISRWLPQFDILNHPNVKAYVGHAGLLGLTEAVYAEVPMILIPMYGDQYTNAAIAEYRGVAILLEYEELNEKIFRHALDEIFNNTRYRDNVKKLSKAFRDRPSSPLETAVWWIEYVGRGNGLAYIRSDAVEQPWYQRHLLDVILFLILLFLFILYAIYRLIKFLSKRTSTKMEHVYDNKKSKKRD
ncbi:PREDICTED: UDP-glucuronosyltransferase 2A3-like [Polistes canadensis]|uniref:UDP-glucuronosyltransferase 2A3-like n=1 Tax=Polistes canadensis TaxID=91411 RepID=UPI000718F579|nr:PREDICTED: UDP-glucuronosyltransferase 2A3-like [Polistes canadensis]